MIIKLTFVASNNLPNVLSTFIQRLSAAALARLYKKGLEGFSPFVKAVVPNSDSHFACETKLAY